MSEEEIQANFSNTSLPLIIKKLDSEYELKPSETKILIGYIYSMQGRINKAIHLLEPIEDSQFTNWVGLKEDLLNILIRGDKE